MADVIRAEVVGSMLRPQELLEAREQVAAGRHHADGVQADRGPRGR